MKTFAQALKDGFEHIKEITDITTVQKLRAEGIAVDDEGYFTYCFGEHKEYELCVEPIGEEGNWQIALYKNRILLTHKLPVWSKT